MRPLLSEFTRNLDQSRTIVVMDEDGLDAPRQYHVEPIALLLRVAGVGLVVVLVTFAVVALSPIRNLIPGYSTEQMRVDAEQNAVRLAQLQDSMRIQIEYMTHLRGLVTGAVADTALPPMLTQPLTDFEIIEPVEVPTEEARTLQSGRVEFAGLVADDRSGGFPLPAMAPVEGFVTRPFDARNEHFAVDIAAASGTSVRSIGDGYVVLSDWTQLGGYAIAIQHPGGYLSVYKHNSTLLKEVGDRVRSQEPIARTGNTGEVTTGPHLHFELWRSGIPQDPRQYVLGW
jgi:murein DD-endopeptidase MepM/ murein hydrolase activator NlpD